MFDKAAATRRRNEVQVLITLTGQTPFDATVFLKADERLIDLLNDPRAFIPVRRADGTTLITAKNNIVSILEIPPPAEDRPGPEALADEGAQAESGGSDKASADTEESAPRAPTERPRRPSDPYEVLRVARDASLDDIRRAYKLRIKAVHPDTIAALDLDEDIERAAHVTAQKVNHAYRRILRERGKESDPPSTAGAA